MWLLQLLLRFYFVPVCRRFVAVASDAGAAAAAPFVPLARAAVSVAGPVASVVLPLYRLLWM